MTKAYSVFCRNCDAEITGGFKVADSHNKKDEYQPQVKLGVVDLQRLSNAIVVMVHVFNFLGLNSSLVGGTMWESYHRERNFWEHNCSWTGKSTRVHGVAGLRLLVVYMSEYVKSWIVRLYKIKFSY